MLNLTNSIALSLISFLSLLWDLCMFLNLPRCAYWVSTALDHLHFGPLLRSICEPYLWFSCSDSHQQVLIIFYQVKMVTGCLLQLRTMLTCPALCLYDLAHCTLLNKCMILWTLEIMSSVTGPMKLHFRLLLVLILRTGWIVMILRQHYCKTHPLSLKVAQHWLYFQGEPWP